MRLATFEREENAYAVSTFRSQSLATEMSGTVWYPTSSFPAPSRNKALPPLARLGSAPQTPRAPPTPGTPQSQAASSLDFGALLSELMRREDEESMASESGEPSPRVAGLELPSIRARLNGPGFDISLKNRPQLKPLRDSAEIRKSWGALMASPIPRRSPSPIRTLIINRGPLHPASPTKNSPMNYKLAREGDIEPVIAETIIPVVQQSLRRAASVDSIKQTEYFRVGANPTQAKHAEMMDTLAVNVSMRGQNLSQWVDALRAKMHAVRICLLYGPNPHRSCRGLRLRRRCEIVSMSQKRPWRHSHVLCRSIWAICCIQ